MLSCMRCRQRGAYLLCATDAVENIIGNCNHIFCIECFKNNNNNNNNNNQVLNNKLKCPCCQNEFFGYFTSTDEAILMGQGVYSNITAAFLEETGADALTVHNAYKKSIKLFEQALSLNPINIFILASLTCVYSVGVTATMRVMRPLDTVSQSGESLDNLIEFSKYKQAVHDYGMRLLDNCFDQHGTPLINRVYVYFGLVGSAFFKTFNNPMALKYLKLAYGLCLRDNDTQSSVYHQSVALLKAELQQVKEAFAGVSPLRFAVGDEVEFLHELDNKWKRGKVVELYYREHHFPLEYNAPYRVQLLDCDSDREESGEAALAVPVYTYVKTDIDSCVRKIGILSIEETRYLTKLDAKVEELSRVYCAKEFVIDVYEKLSRDLEFCAFLQCSLQLELSLKLLYVYRMLVMYRQPMVRTATGYVIPTVEEVAEQFKAFFFKTKTCSTVKLDAALIGDEGLNVYLIDISILSRFDTFDVWLGDHSLYEKVKVIDAVLSSTFIAYVNMYRVDQNKEVDDMPAYIEGGFTHTPPALFLTPEANAKMAQATLYSITHLIRNNAEGDKFFPLYRMWKPLLAFLNGTEAGVVIPDAVPPYDYPLIFFLVRFALGQGMGIPPPVLAVYEGMCSHLSSSFIRCGNPTCEHHKLDRSEGRIKFKQCTRCKAVIYCSRECQTAHYPDHKTLCREHLAGRKG